MPVRAVLQAFQVVREGEQDRFTKQLHNRQLLWHGSRTTNFVGILSQVRVPVPGASRAGTWALCAPAPLPRAPTAPLVACAFAVARVAGQGLRIAPPEAPVTGYMFGKVRGEPCGADCKAPVPEQARVLDLPASAACCRVFLLPTGCVLCRLRVEVCQLHRHLQGRRGPDWPHAAVRRRTWGHVRVGEALCLCLWVFGGTPCAAFVRMGPTCGRGRRVLCTWLPALWNCWGPGDTRRAVHLMQHVGGNARCAVRWWCGQVRAYACGVHGEGPQGQALHQGHRPLPTPVRCRSAELCRCAALLHARRRDRRAVQMRHPAACARAGCARGAGPPPSPPPLPTHPPPPRLPGASCSPAVIMCPACLCACIIMCPACPCACALVRCRETAKDPFKVLDDEHGRVVVPLAKVSGLSSPPPTSHTRCGCACTGLCSGLCVVDVCAV
jgi:hypothetical protein